MSRRRSTRMPTLFSEDLFFSPMEREGRVHSVIYNRNSRAWCCGARAVMLAPGVRFKTAAPLSLPRPMDPCGLGLAGRIPLPSCPLSAIPFLALPPSQCNKPSPTLEIHCSDCALCPTRIHLQFTCFLPPTVGGGPSFSHATSEDALLRCCGAWVSAAAGTCAISDSHLCGQVRFL